jgi:hypothetical protein
MHKRFFFFCCFYSCMFVVAVHAGVAGNSFVKKNFGGIFREKGASYIFDTDSTLFMAIDALPRSGAIEWLVTSQALFLKSMVAFQQWAGIQQYIGKRRGEGGKNNC